VCSPLCFFSSCEKCDRWLKNKRLVLMKSNSMTKKRKNNSLIRNTKRMKSSSILISLSKFSATIYSNRSLNTSKSLDLCPLLNHTLPIKRTRKLHCSEWSTIRSQPRKISTCCSLLTWLSNSSRVTMNQIKQRIRLLQLLVFFHCF